VGGVCPEAELGCDSPPLAPERASCEVVSPDEPQIDSDCGVESPTGSPSVASSPSDAPEDASADPEDRVSEASSDACAPLLRSPDSAEQLIMATHAIANATAAAMQMAALRFLLSLASMISPHMNRATALKSHLKNPSTNLIAVHLPSCTCSSSCPWIRPSPWRCRPRAGSRSSRRGLQGRRRSRGTSSSCSRAGAQRGG